MSRVGSERPTGTDDREPTPNTITVRRDSYTALSHGKMSVLIGQSRTCLESCGLGVDRIATQQRDFLNSLERARWIGGTEMPVQRCQPTTGMAKAPAAGAPVRNCAGRPAQIRTQSPGMDYEYPPPRGHGARLPRFPSGLAAVYANAA